MSTNDMPKSRDRSDLLQGTLDMLILKALSLGALHGYGIIQRIRQMSDEMLDVEQGSLYPALYRMERDGWIEADWGVSELGRRAKFYALTTTGRQRLRAETAEWRRFADGVSRILLPT